MQSKVSYLGILFLVICISLFEACKNRNSDFPPCEDVQLEVYRFDQDVRNIPNSNYEEEILSLKEKYHHFYSVYSGDPYLSTDSFPAVSNQAAQALVNFLSFEPTKALFDRSDEYFRDFTAYANEIEKALCRIEKAFPEHRKNYSLITYLEEPHIVPDPQRLHGVNRLNDSTFTIGLHRYLGEDYEFYTYPGVNVYQYQLHRMEPEYIPVTFVEFFYEKHFRDYSKDENTLLFNMIEEGKKYYFMQQVLPETPAYMIMGFKQEEWELSEKFEFFVWQTLIENELLYTNSLEEIKWYVGEGPNSRRMDDRLPGNIGSFIGWKIVEAYIENQKERPGLDEIVELSPNELFLGARYDPDAPIMQQGRSAWIIRVGATVLLLSVVAGYIFYRKRKKKTSSDA